MTRCKKIHEFVAHAANVNCLAFGPQSHQIMATGGEDQKVNLWRVTNAANFWSLSGHSSAIDCLCFDPTENYVVSGSHGGTLKVYDLEEGKVARNLSSHRSAVTCLDYHPYGEFLISGSLDTNFKIWDLRSKKCVLTYKGHSAKLTAARFSPDGQWTATSGEDGLLTIWELRKKEVIHTFRTEGGGSILTFDFNPKELLIAAATSERVVRVWDTERFEPVGTGPNEAHPIRAMAFSKDGSKLYTASAGGLRVLNGLNASLEEHVDVAWGDRVAGVTLAGAPSEPQLVAGACDSSFVSIWATGGEDSKAERGRARMMPQPRPPQQVQQARPPARSATPTSPPDDGPSRSSPLDPPPPSSSSSSDPPSSLPPRRRVTSEPYIEVAVPPPRAPPEPQPQPFCEAKDQDRLSPPFAPRDRQEGKDSRDRDSPAPHPVTDDEVIVSTLLHRSTVITALSTRLSHLQILSDMWKRGNGQAAFDLLRRLHEGHREDRRKLTVVADFLRVVNLRSECVSLEVALLLLPVLNSLLALDFENHVIVALRAVETLVSTFGNYVRQVRHAPRSCGVDLTREERLRKCDELHEYLESTCNLLDGTRRAFKRESLVHTVLARVDRQLHDYMQD